MFVKKIPRWKIKRFFKKIISAIIFLSILFSLALPSFAVNRDGFYDSFDDLIGDGVIELALFNSSGSNVDTKVIYGEYDNVDQIVFGSEVATTPFESLVFNIGHDSPNIQQKFSSGDSFVLRQFIALHIPQGDSIVDYYKNFSIEILYRDSDNQYQNLSFDSSKFLSSHDLVEYPDGISIFFNIDLSTLLPEDGTIENIYYRLNHFVHPSVRLVFFPSYPVSGADSSNFSAPLTFYVGSRDEAPLYPSVDDAPLTDFEDAENNLIDSALQGFRDWALFLADIPNHILSVFNWLRGASDIFMLFYNSLDWRFRSAIMVLLCVGTFSYIIGITSTVLSKIER